MEVFETERLKLKPCDAEDAAFLLALLNSENWLHNIGNRNVHTEEEAKMYIKNRITQQFERLGFGNYVVIRKADATKMGVCGLYERPGLAHIDIGFAFFPEYEGRGYAFEASQKLIRLAFQKFGLKKLVAITLEENNSSRKLLEKLGLKYIKMTAIEGKELMVYEIEAAEFGL